MTVTNLENVNRNYSEMSCHMSSDDFNQKKKRKKDQKQILMKAEGRAKLEHCCLECRLI